MSERKTGTVKFFNAQKGFGFITPDGGGSDHFVHISAVNKSNLGDIGEGDKLSYTVGEDRGRPCAANLQRA